MNETLPPAPPVPASRTWDVLCHVSSLVGYIGVPFGNILGPLIIWLIKRGESPSVDAHGKESLNFQISITLYLLIAAGVTVSLMFILIGFLLLPLLIVLACVVPIVSLILVIVASVKASEGQLYRYPLTIRLIS